MRKPAYRMLFNMQKLVARKVITKEQMIKYQNMMTSGDEEMDNLASIQLQEIWKTEKNKIYDYKTRRLRTTNRRG